MDLSSWTLGLLLIVLTIAIHTSGVVMLASVSKRGFGSAATGTCMSLGARFRS